MKKRLHILLTAVYLLLMPISVHAQSTTYHIPEGVTLETTEVCRQHKDDFIRVGDELLSTPVDAPERKRANGFVLLWMTNTDEVSLRIDAGPVMKRFEKADDLLLIYMLGSSRYVLRTHDTDASKGSVAGYRAALAYYKNPAYGIARTKKMDRLVKLEAEGKLEEEVAPMLKRQ